MPNWTRFDFRLLVLAESADPADTGVAGVDIYRFDADGKAAEHWDTLQLVGSPSDSARWVSPNLPRVNSQGMF